MSRTTEQLLTALEPLPHRARLRLAATTARDLAAAGELDPVLEELNGRGRYERRLAALAAFAGRRTQYLCARLTDPDPVVRGYALRAARTPLVPDEAIIAAYEDASAEVRGQLSRTVRRGGRRALAEALLPRLRARWGDHEAAALLPACGPETVARLLPGLADAVGDWTRLARRHPGPVLDNAEAELAGLPDGLRDSWWARRSSGPAAAAPAEPLRVLGLLERYGPTTPQREVRDRLGLLARADAERLVRWLADPARRQPRYEPAPAPSLLRRLVRADPPSLPVLGRRWLRSPEHLAALFEALPPARREAFHDAVTQDLTPATWNLAAPLLPLLPPPRRYTEARLAVARERTTGRPLPGALPPSLAHLPVAEVRAEILAACGGSDADRRADAWVLLVANAADSGDPEAVAEVLALIAGRLRNDRDPVRSAVLEGLVRLPVGLLRSPSTPGHLAAIALDALQARDSSYATRNAVRGLLLAVLDDPAAGADLVDWALRALCLLVDRTGGAMLGGRDWPARQDRRDRVFSVLRPWAETAAGKGDFVPLLKLAHFVDNDRALVPGLEPMITDALERCEDESAPHLANVWLDDPATREERAVALLAREPSAAALKSVREVLSARRSDLLDVLLTGQPPSGRFLREDSARPLPVLTHASRWLPRQQEAAARLTAAAVRDESATLYERTSAIREAAQIPDHGLALIREFTSSENTVLAEAALAAAARTVEPAAVLDELLAHSGGDRARVAVYAAGRAAAATAPSALAHRITELLDPGREVKVTSRKEAARLAARLLPPALAVALMGRIGRDPASHPDLKAVAMRLALGLLPAEAAWELLEAAAAGSPDSRAALLDTAPLTVRAEHRPRFARLVAAATGVRDGAAAGIAPHHHLSLPKWAAYDPEPAETLRLAVCDLTPRGAAHHAVSALAQIAASTLPHPVGGAEPGSPFHRAVAELLDIVRAGEEPDAEPDLDRPALRRLRQLAAQPLGDRPAAREAVLRQLAGEPLLAEARVNLLLRAVDLRADPADPARQRAALHELVAALRGRPGLARATASRLTTRYGHGDLLPDPASVLETTRGLAADGTAEAGLFAAALTAAVGRLHGWPAPWRELLRELRRHPEAEVRDAAFSATTQA
ncbi:hypothetical protein [Streptomyces sp. ICC4]|uniref:hypothetical protein n=1 Tax=Streptomyces sp. ICC4 TaxID=2099584 RepID=UPI000DC76D12|nr:hypothetical protein [Streptomyces sp. ICC4]AWZ08411.1 hypothetical protein DRB89_31790 [Streptomyces sp. ICC4]